MKKITFVILFLALFFYPKGIKSQNNQDCTIKYNLFRGDFKAKRYDAAYDNWLWTFDNCPKLSINIYRNGVVIAEHRYEKETLPDKKQAALDLVKKVFDRRIENFPEDLGRVYSDYATFMAKVPNSDQTVFSLLEKGFIEDPTRISSKNIYKYFDMVLNRNKDTDPQKVFDIYDDVIDGMEKQREEYTKKIEQYNVKQEQGKSLTDKEKKDIETYQKILTNLALVESGLDAKISIISTCDRLKTIYSKTFEDNKSDSKWLKRAVSRMYNKECTDDPLYDKLVEAYVSVNPSAEAYVFYAGYLLKSNQESKATEYFEKAVELETDSYKRANYLYKIAQIMTKIGRKAQARNYAKQAINNAPTMGSAYLLIAGLYSSSANDCGKNEFEKRMTYVAARDMAIKAVQVDPSISKKAQALIKNYQANMPSKKLIFTEGLATGDSYKIDCWIGEKVMIP